MPARRKNSDFQFLLNAWRNDSRRVGVIGIAILASILGISSAAAQQLGPETNQPLPRFVSVKAGEANVRRGPSLTHRVDWVFHHRGLPLMVIAEHGHWRQVRDRDGLGGWVHYAMLSSSPTAVVMSEMTELRRQPNLESPVTARAERDVVLRIANCKPDWCKVSAGNHKGWAQVTDLWGATQADME